MIVTLLHRDQDWTRKRCEPSRSITGIRGVVCRRWWRVETDLECQLWT